MYNRTIWVDGSTPVDASRLNKIENGVYESHNQYNQLLQGYPDLPQLIDNANTAALRAEEAATGIVPNDSITPLKISKSRTNIFDKSKISYGQIDFDGAFTETLEHITTDYMPCEPGGVYSCPGGNRRRGAFYTANKTFIKVDLYSTYALPGQITAPDNAYYFRLSYGAVPYEGVSGININTAMVCTGNEYFSSYIPYGAEIPWLYSQIPEKSIKADNMAGAIKNILNLKTCIPGQINMDGTFTATPEHITTDYMPCEPGGVYSCPGGNRRRGAFYTANKTFIKVDLYSTYALPGQITAPDNAYYFRLSYGAVPYEDVNGWDEQNSMVCPGNEYSDTFIPYEGTKIPWLYSQIPEKAIKADNMAETITNVLSLDDCSPEKLLNDGSTSADIAYFVSDWIPVKSEEYYTFPPGDDRCICFYDSMSNFISNISDSGTATKATYIIPNNCTFMRVSYQIASFDVWNPMVCRGREYPKEYAGAGVHLPWLDKNPLQGKKLAVLGDSICALHKSYITAVGYQNNMDFIRADHNQSVWGSPIARHNFENEPDSFVERFSLLRDSTDYLVIHGGVNDARLNIPIGELSAWNDYESEVDEFTFYGALESLIRKAQIKYTSAKIVFVASYKLLHLPDMKDYIEAIKTACNKYSVPVLDLYNYSGINIGIPQMRDKYFSDDTHLNAWGHLRLVGIATNFLKQYEMLG